MISCETEILSARTMKPSCELLLQLRHTTAHPVQRRRFLRARKFDLAQSKKMFADCQHWRKTVEGIGIDKLYSETDPFDVGATYLVFIVYSDPFSIQNGKLSFNAGQCGSIR